MAQLGWVTLIDNDASLDCKLEHPMPNFSVVIDDETLLDYGDDLDKLWFYLQDMALAGKGWWHCNRLEESIMRTGYVGWGNEEFANFFMALSMSHGVKYMELQQEKDD